MAPASATRESDHRDTFQQIGAVMGDYVASLNDIRLTDAGQVGGKGANLGEMVAAKLPVPPGFVILRSTYETAVADGPHGPEIDSLHAEALRSAVAADDAGRAQLDL